LAGSVLRGYSELNERPDIIHFTAESASEFFTAFGFRCIASEAETTHVRELTHAT
jgi:hypothetical protein